MDASKWDRPAIFDWLQKTGGVASDEMYRVFNMGIGLAMIVSPYYADSIRRTLAQHGHESWLIGNVSATDDGSKSVKLSK